MSKATYFVCGCLFTLSIVLIAWSFEVADAVRGYNATGSEVFMIALPLMLISRMLSMAERNEKKLKNQLKKERQQNSMK